ncbi:MULTISPECIES: ACP S-malonyltransferase [Bacillus subtilis group]|uniref:[acyl-carrier-protein] S-malonyltransferase n=2 Tax=Bacteria TaxID=2 RepID=A0A8I2B899_BACIU|nr:MULTISPECIES: ACP S-malonyltransferase [Bacillus subtilis group]MBO3795704.1 ACP S-malonyltransferase [Bacillus subtilis]MDL5613741.1 ACP S-malonyltransferase [Bacillus halotolerans]
MEKIFMFAGQGCHFYGMGKKLYETNFDFRKNIDAVDHEIVKFAGISVRDIVFDENKNRGEAFLPILQTNLAIFMYEYSAAQMMIQNGIVPNGVIGASLGEFSGAVISGMIEMQDAVALLVKLSELIMDKAPMGGMITVFDDASVFQNRKDIFTGSELVAVNHSHHFVVSANSERIRSIKKRLSDNSILSQVLPVQYAFHSREIESMREECCRLFAEVNLKQPACKIISSVTGKALDQVKMDYFWEVIREQIRFKESITNTVTNDTMFIDLSPDGELAAMLHYILPEHKDVFKIASLFNVDMDVTSIMNTIKETGGHKMKAYVFPGQGSQEKGMGAELFDEFSELTQKADEILGYSIKDLCLNDPENKLGLTVYTQPALYVVSVFSYLKKLKDGEGEPDYLAGHSIGEYAALFASGAIDFETGLKLVKKRGELMFREAGGQMAAVVGLTKEQVEQVLHENKLTNLDVANMNTPNQIVIAGYREDIQKAKDPFQNHSNCMMYKVLNVSGAFHSRYMQPARDEFTEYLQKFKIGSMKIPVISNVYARPYRQSRVLETLSEQLVSSVEWTDSIRYLLAKGVEDIIQVGPGRVVQGMVQTIIRDAEPIMIEEEDLPTERYREEQDEIMEEVHIKSEAEVTNSTINETGFPKTISKSISPEMLGDGSFIHDYNLKYAYILGGMYRGISGERLVTEAGKAGLLAFYGTVGVDDSSIEKGIKNIQRTLKNGEPYGFSLSPDFENPEREKRIFDLFLRYGVRTIEASGYVTITKPLVKYRIKGLKEDGTGNVIIQNRIIAKLSRPEVAECYMSPPPKKIVDSLLREGEITETEAQLSQQIPMAYDICVQGDSGGHTDAANGFVLLPTFFRLRSEMTKKHGYHYKIRLGVGGGIGTPTAAAGAFIMGADFITTGSINQCSVEADISVPAKEMLSGINVQDTGYAPSWDLYETSSKVQVLKKGTLYQVRSNKLHSIYSSHHSIDGIDEMVKKQIENNYFKKSLEEVYTEVKQYTSRKTLKEAEINPKLKMLLTFKWYFIKSAQWALNGEEDNQSDYQILCGSALGSFNQWVKGSEMEDWRNRHVADIGTMLMTETAEQLNEYCKQMLV